jgi:hypothetical protein
MLTSVASSPSTAKPPNVLIYQFNKDSTTPGFVRVKESLEASLTPERYVIYPLGEDDICQYSPWKDNCRLLVIPPLIEHDGSHDPTMLPPRVMEELISYVLAGGKLLSMQSDLNRILGFPPLQEAIDDQKLLKTFSRDSVCDVEVYSGMECGCKFSCLVPGSSGTRNEVYLGNLPIKDSILSSTDMAYFIPLEWNENMEWIDQNTNQSNSNHDQSDYLLGVTSQNFPCVRELEFSNNGHAVLAGMDICPVLPQGLNVLPLVRLKKGVTLRGQYLTQLLRRLGLECSDEQLPLLTHTFLICSDEVSHSLVRAQCGYNSSVSMETGRVTMATMACIVVSLLEVN